MKSLGRDLRKHVGDRMDSEVHPNLYTQVADVIGRLYLIRLCVARPLEMHIDHEARRFQDR